MSKILIAWSRIRNLRKDAEGSVIVFTLFVLVMMLIVSGMAIDFVRYTAASARIQDTADRAAIVATSLDNDLDPTEVVTQYFAAAGLEDRLDGVTVVDTGDFRRVGVSYNFDVDTLFLRLGGLETLTGSDTSTAVQGTSNVEISLLLDISASMFGSRIEALRPAAVGFAEEVLDPSFQGLVSMNVIAFAGDTNVGPEMFSFLQGVSYLDGLDEEDIPLVDINNTPGNPDDDIPYPDDVTHCLLLGLSPADMASADLPFGLPQTPHFLSSTFNINNRDSPHWCVEDAEIQYAVQDAGELTDPDSLVSFLNTLPLGPGTGTHVAMNYATALLNPTSQPAFEFLNTFGKVPDDFVNRPAAYDGIGVQKVIIVMSDGRPFQTRLPRDFIDPRNLVEPVFDNGGPEADVVLSSEENRIEFEVQCDIAKEPARNTVVYSIGFEVDDDARDRLRRCASSASHYLDATEDNISDVFNAIADEITALRIVN